MTRWSFLCGTVRAFILFYDTLIPPHREYVKQVCLPNRTKDLNHSEWIHRLVAYPIKEPYYRTTLLSICIRVTTYRTWLPNTLVTAFPILSFAILLLPDAHL